MNFEEWKSLTAEEKETYIKIAETEEKKNKSLIRSYHYWSNKKEKEEENE